MRTRCREVVFLPETAPGLPAVQPAVILMDHMVVATFLQPDALIGEASHDWNGPSP